jgi:Ca-activated chloride channel family protein
LTPELMPVDGDALVQALKLAESLLQKTGVPGSALVMADIVAPSQVQTLSENKTEIPVQFLSLQSPSAPDDNGLQRAAKTLNASVVKLTVDKTDVQQANRRAQSELKAVTGSFGEQRWHDNGYALVPLIVLCTLMWFRKGWVIR